VTTAAGYWQKYFERAAVFVSVPGLACHICGQFAACTGSCGLSDVACSAFIVETATLPQNFCGKKLPGGLADVHVCSIFSRAGPASLLNSSSLLLLSESRRSWQKSAWTLHAIAQQGQRVTISSNGSPPSWAQPIPRELLFRTCPLACGDSFLREHALQKGVFPLKSPCLFSPVPLTFLFPLLYSPFIPPWSFPLRPVGWNNPTAADLGNDTGVKWSAWEGRGGIIERNSRSLNAL